MTKKESTNYRELNAELNAIIEVLQDGELDVDAAVAKYERGMLIAEELKEYLTSTENKITKLKNSFSS